MHVFRISMIVLVTLGFVLAVASCNSLAITGDKKYKADISNALQNVKNEIEQNGSVSDVKLKKLESVVANYEADYSNKSSLIIAKQALDAIHQAQAEPNNQFNLLQQASGDIYAALDALKTEFND